jgi:hypothetical protein
MKCWNHISTSTSHFHNTKYIMFCNIQTIEIFKLNQIQSHINLLIHQEVCVNSNTTCSPQRGMHPFGIETIWDSPWHITIWSFFIIFIHSFNPLHNEIAFFPPLLLICMLNISICILCTRICYLQPFFLNCVLTLVNLSTTMAKR